MGVHPLPPTLASCNPPREGGLESSRPKLQSQPCHPYPWELGQTIRSNHMKLHFCRSKTVKYWQIHKIQPNI